MPVTALQFFSSDMKHCNVKNFAHMRTVLLLKHLGAQQQKSTKFMRTCEKFKERDKFQCVFCISIFTSGCGLLFFVSF